MSNKPVSAVEVEGFNRLAPREQAFVQHPDVYRDPKKAAKEVGYSSSTIEKRAHSMRQRLMRFIQPAFEVQLASLGVDRRRIEDELAAIGFVDVTEYQETIDIEMKDGGFQSVVVWKDPMQLPKHMRKAIRSVVYGSFETADGETVQSDRPVMVHFHSKEKALKELAGLFGDVVPKNPADEQQELFDNLDIADREELVRIHMKAARRAVLKQQPIEGTHGREETVQRAEVSIPAGSARPRRITDQSSSGAEDSISDVLHAPPVGGVRPGRQQPRVAAAAPRRARAPSSVVLEDGGESDVGFRDLPS